MGAVDDRLRELRELEARQQSRADIREPGLRQGGGGSTSGPMDERVTRLEVQMEQVGKMLGSIDGKLDKVNDRLNLLPTRNDLWAWKWQWTALALAVVAIVIGGIIGGLSWIKPDAPAVAAPAPVVIQMPSAPAVQRK